MTRWELDGEFVLRHPGMPFDWVEELGADPELDLAADEVVDAARELADAAGGSGPVATAVRRVRAMPADGTAPTGRWNEAVARYREALSNTYARLERRLHRIASEERVQEAVFVSNPDMWANMWRRYVEAAEPGAITSARRRVHRQVYTYVQRFCAKNETTSFFGPIAYGRLDGRGADECVLVRGLPQRRLVFLSPWAVAALARAVRRDPAVRAALPVTVVDAARAATVLAPDDPLLVHPDRAWTVGRLAEEHGVDTRQVVRLLRPALTANAVEIGPVVGPAGDDFAALRRIVDDMGEHPGASAWRDRLAVLEEVRRELERAAFPARAAVFERIERLFTDATATPARRQGGLYTDRFVVYEESSSPFRLELGGAAARKLTASVQEALDQSAAYGDTLRRGHQEHVLRRWPDVSRLPLPAYLDRAAESADGTRFSAGPPIPAPLAAPARPGPRYALPDLCLAAPDVDAIAAGAFRVVVSRVHHHLLLNSWLAVAHPDPAGFAVRSTSWVGRHGAAVGLLGIEVSRRNKAFYRFPGEKLALRPRNAVDVGDPSVRHVGDFDVVRDGDVLRLVDRDGRERTLYLPLADLVTHPPLAALSSPPALHPQIRPPGAQRVPAVVLGGAVYQRSRWHTTAPDLKPLDMAARYVALRGIARELELPRFVYIRSDRRRKPYLLDTRSPFAAELLAHVTEPGEDVQLEEMLPAPDDLWLRDEQGRRYTAELRVQAVTSW